MSENGRIAKGISGHLHGEDHAETILIVKEALDKKDSEITALIDSLCAKLKLAEDVVEGVRQHNHTDTTPPCFLCRLLRAYDEGGPQAPKEEA